MPVHQSRFQSARLQNEFVEELRDVEEGPDGSLWMLEDSDSGGPGTDHRPIVSRGHSLSRRLHLVMHDFEPGWDTYVERPGYGMQADLSFDQVEVGDYDAILLLGGRAPELRLMPFFSSPSL